MCKMSFNATVVITLFSFLFVSNANARIHKSFNELTNKFKFKFNPEITMTTVS